MSIAPAVAAAPVTPITAQAPQTPATPATPATPSGPVGAGVAEEAAVAGADAGAGADDTAVDDTAADTTAVDDTVVFDAVAETAPLPPIAATPLPPVTTPLPPAPPTPLPPVAAQPSVAQPAAATPTPPRASPTVAQADADIEDFASVEIPKKRRKAWIIPFVIVGLAVLYVGAQALLSNTVPRSTETMGVAIGGMAVAQAEGEVSDHATELKTTDLEMSVADEVFALPAADAGLDVDAKATVAQVTGFTLAPDRLWAHIVGGGELDPVAVVDEGELADAVESAAAHFDGPAQDAGVTVTNGAVEMVPGRFAVTVDQEASAALIAEQWPASHSIELVALTEEPAVTDADAQAFALDLESHTFAGAVTLAGDDAEAVVEPATIADHATVVTGDSGLELEIDGESLAAAILEANPDLSTEGKNASVSFDEDHNIVIDEGTPGITIDAQQLGSAVLAAAHSSDRIGVLPYTAADPEVSAEDLGLADFQEIVSTFNTPLTSEWVRTENLRTAASKVQGVILQPGESFDLVDVLSPITVEEGYGNSGVIVNGVLTQGMGGGLSQMATNTYNVAYFAGYELIEHRPHSVWFTRYPAGRESTMYTGSINVVFRNNTPYAAVLNSYVEGGRLYTDIWSTEHFEVKTAASPRSNVRQPGVKEVTSADCQPKGPGHPGFTITNTRTVLLDGAEVDHNSDTWTYRPDDAIKCVSPDKDDKHDDD